MEAVVIFVAYQGQRGEGSGTENAVVIVIPPRRSALSAGPTESATDPG